MLILCRQTFRIADNGEELYVKNGELKSINDRWLEHPFIKSMIESNLLVVQVDTANLDKKVEELSNEEAIKDDEKVMEIEMENAKNEAIKKAEVEAAANGLDEASKKNLVEDKVKEAQSKVKKAQSKAKDKK